jgi:hypothetical protein
MQSAAVLSATAIGGILLPAPPAAAPDRAQGVALMSATIRGNGTLVSSSGLVDASRIVAGGYRLEFARSIGACTVVANVSKSGPGSGSPSGHVSTSGTTNVLIALTRDLDGDQVDRDFHIIVFCPR